MKLKATRPVSSMGAERTPGEVFEADTDEAQRLVWLGWAEKATDTEKEGADGAGKKEARKARSRKGDA